MITPDTLEREVRAYVAEGSGISSSNVIPGNDKGPRPGVVYASLLLRTDRQLGLPIIRYDDTALEPTITYWRRAVFSLQFYRAGATLKAREFADWSESEVGGLPDENARGFRVERPHEVTRLDTLVADEKIEERAGIELTIKYSYTLRKTAGVISTIGAEICTDTSREDINVEDI